MADPINPYESPTHCEEREQARSQFVDRSLDLLAALLVNASWGVIFAFILFWVPFVVGPLGLIYVVVWRPQMLPRQEWILMSLVIPWWIFEGLLLAWFFSVI